MSDYPREAGHHGGTTCGYSVEARLDYSRPREVAGRLLDNRWVTLTWRDAAVGVPKFAAHQRMLGEHDLLSYPAAQALRWWFHAVAHAEGNHYCLDTRLVKHEVKFDTSATAVSDHCLVGGDDRSNIMPDWGSKRAEED